MQLHLVDDSKVEVSIPESLTTKNPHEVVLVAFVWSKVTKEIDFLNDRLNMIEQTTNQADSWCLISCLNVSESKKNWCFDVSRRSPISANPPIDVEKFMFMFLKEVVT